MLIGRIKAYRQRRLLLKFKKQTINFNKKHKAKPGNFWLCTDIVAKRRFKKIPENKKVNAIAEIVKELKELDLISE